MEGEDGTLGADGGARWALMEGSSVESQAMEGQEEHGRFLTLYTRQAHGGAREREGAWTLPHTPCTRQ